MTIIEQGNREQAEVDWDAAVTLAESLGRRTLTLVARRDLGALRDWCLENASANSAYPGTAERAASYLELAVLVGHQPWPEPAAVPPAEDADEDDQDAEGES